MWVQGRAKQNEKRKLPGSRRVMCLEPSVVVVPCGRLAIVNRVYKYIYKLVMP